MTITINGKEVKLKWTNRAQIVFENLTGHSISMYDKNKPYTESIMTFWAFVVGSNNGKEDISFDEFIDEIDEKPWLLTEFAEWSENQANEQAALLSKQDRIDAKKN